ncbi:ABC-type transport auxiliary lipoprotein family protein [Noviherbaspirillum denitrificans]|uniref:ABC transporter n=1 Tax=Noviherbaspirillum denitrificans TaxID=1968433 RepID=A0A254TCC3_9BURK|nr:ABC-type transport auxiliary lipoprotein family protein [Noviherbaspirillum denitrificans]OWW19817.1 ABC transporter [Noviherbaspirillum denitrificans]
MNRSVSAIVLLLAAALSGCAIVNRSESVATLYDLGPLTTQQGLPALPPVSVAGVQMPAWLDSSMMFYRLDYANAQQPRAYAQARWTMTPAQLLTQHLKARIAQAGGVALAASDGALDVPVLRIEADDFTQHFASASESTGQVALRASLYRGRALVAQRSFVRQSPAGSADAPGGAAALSVASDAAIGDIIQWLHGLPLK